MILLVLSCDLNKKTVAKIKSYLSKYEIEFEIHCDIPEIQDKHGDIFIDLAGLDTNGLDTVKELVRSAKKRPGINFNIIAPGANQFQPELEFIIGERLDNIRVIFIQDQEDLFDVIEKYILRDEKRRVKKELFKIYKENNGTEPTIKMVNENSGIPSLDEILKLFNVRTVWGLWGKALRGNNLPRRNRLIYHIRMNDNLSQAEIGRLLEITRQRVQSIIKEKRDEAAYIDSFIPGLLTK